ncbi:MAG: hypothetical protein AB1397_01995 [bacterium]
MLAWVIIGFAIAEERQEEIAGEEELLFREIPVVVTAAKKEQLATEAPAIVTVITEEEIKKWAHATSLMC